MPNPKSKRGLVLLSTVIATFDESDLLAVGRLLRGDDDADRLFATSDDNWLIEGRGGPDTILGAGGDDLLIARRATLGDDPRDRETDGDNAIGVVTGRLPSDGVTIKGGGGNDIVIGGSGRDNLEGNAGNDILYGFEGDDVLKGGRGDDFLAGGVGNATLDGGAGIDTASWADLPYLRGEGKVAGIVLNLSDDTIRYESGDRKGDAQILVRNEAGDFVVLGDADTAPSGGPRPGGETAFDIDSGTGVVPFGLLVPAIVRVRDAKAGVTIERYEGTLGDADVAVLNEGFAFRGMTVDGYSRYSDGRDAVDLRGFETVLFNDYSCL